MNYTNMYISKNRTKLMGFAIIISMLFHATVQTDGWIYMIKQSLDIGVNIFFVLSGYSMVYAWKNAPFIKKFYYNRILRVMVVYLPVTAVWVTLTYLIGKSTLFESFCKLLTIWCWVSGGGFNWFISALMVFYLITPFVLILYDKNPRIFILLSLAISITSVLLGVFGPLQYVNFFAIRVPTYFLGLFLGLYQVKQGKLHSTIVCLGMIVGIALYIMCYISCPEYKYLSYLPMTYSIVYLLSIILDKVKGLICTFAGTITLEIYIFHEKIIQVFEILIDKIGIIFDQYGIVLNIIAALVGIISAYIYHKLSSKIYRRIKK